MKKHLFYTFLVIFAATALVTLLGLINLVPVREGFLTGLVTAFLIELAGAVIAMFRTAKFFTEDETLVPLTKELTETKASLGERDARISTLQADVNRIQIEYRQLRLEFDQLKSLRRRIMAVLGASSRDVHGVVMDLGLSSSATGLADVQSVIGELVDSNETEPDPNKPSGYYRRRGKTIAG